MTTPIEIGWRPIPIAPIFAYGQDWIATFEPVEGSPEPVFPDGTTVTAYLYVDNKLETLAGPPLRSWPCQIVDDTVRIHVEAAETNTVPKNHYLRVAIVYPGTPLVDPFIWAKGKVVRDD